MAQGRIYVYRSGGITTSAIEGIARGLEKGVKEYREEGKFRGLSDFSPIFGDKDNKLFMVGNLYHPEVCTMTVCQYLDQRQAKTSLVCHGTSDLGLEFLKDFARTLDFRTIEPSQELKDEALLAYGPIETLWAISSFLGRPVQKLVFVESLRLQLQNYRVQKIKSN